MSESRTLCESSKPFAFNDPRFLIVAENNSLHKNLLFELKSVVNTKVSDMIGEAECNSNVPSAPPICTGPGLSGAFISELLDAQEELINITRQILGRIEDL